MNRCSRSERWISAGLDEELDSDRRAALHAHLSRCPRCRARYSQADRLQQFLRRTVDPSEGGDGLLIERVLSAVAREPRRPTPASVSRLPMVGAAALFAALLGWGAVSIDPESPPTAHPAPSPRAVLIRKQAAPLPAIAVLAPPSILHRRADQPAVRTVQRRPMRLLIARLPDPPAPPSGPVRSAPRPLEAVPAKAHVVLPRAARLATIEAAGSPHSRLDPACGPVRLHGIDGVALTRSDSTEWAAISADSPVRDDQRLKSGQDSRVELALGGVDVRMNEETEVAPLRAPEPGAPYWVIRLVRGELFARMPKGGYGLRIMTPAGDVIAQEGEILVRANDLFETRLVVSKGSARVENAAGEVVGVAGTRITCRIGGPPEPAEPAFDSQDEFRWAYAPLPGAVRPIARPG